MKKKDSSSQTDQAVFDARAKNLAKVFKEKSKGSEDSFLVFCLGVGKDEKYALSYQHVERVVPLQCLTPVPGATKLFLGVTYYNAQVWPVIDTEALFNFNLEKMNPEYIILVREGTYRYALAVRYSRLISK